MELSGYNKEAAALHNDHYIVDWFHCISRLHYFLTLKIHLVQIHNTIVALHG